MELHQLSTKPGPGPVPIPGKQQRGQGQGRAELSIQLVQPQPLWVALSQGMRLRQLSAEPSPIPVPVPSERCQACRRWDHCKQCYQTPSPAPLKGMRLRQRSAESSPVPCAQHRARHSAAPLAADRARLGWCSRIPCKPGTALREWGRPWLGLVLSWCNLLPCEWCHLQGTGPSTEPNQAQLRLQIFDAAWCIS